MKKELLGCLELALFMKQGINRFDGSVAAMKRSFIIPLLLWPLAIPFRMFNPQTAGRSFPDLALRSILDTALCILTSLAFGYVLALALKRLDRFPLCVTAGNWMSIPITVIMLPLLAMLFTGVHSWHDVNPAIVMIMLYETACSAFLVTLALRVPWELGTSLALLGAALDGYIFNLMA